MLYEVYASSINCDMNYDKQRFIDKSEADLYFKSLVKRHTKDILVFMFKGQYFVKAKNGIK